MVVHYEVVFSSSSTCFFSPFLLTRWFFITRWGGSRPRAGAARVRGERERCVPVPEFPCFRLFVCFRVFPCVCVLDLPEPEGHLLNGSSLDQSGKRPGNPGVPAAGRSAGKLQLFTECFPEICFWEPFLFHSNASCIWKFSPPFICLLNRCYIEWVSG